MYYLNIDKVNRRNDRLVGQSFYRFENEPDCHKALQLIKDDCMLGGIRIDGTISDGKNFPDYIGCWMPCDLGSIVGEILVY